MKHVLGFRCFACGNELPLSDDILICPLCGGNLDVVYNYNIIKKNIKRKDIDKRCGIDKFRSLLPINESTKLVPLRVGETPLYSAEKLSKKYSSAKVFLKDETHEPSASFKDRASFMVLAKADEFRVKMVAGASTGNAASSIAALSASVGRKVKIFVPESAPPAKITQLLIYGADVYLVKGNYDDAFELCSKACLKYGWFNRNTGYNPYTREGKKTCALEISQQLRWNPPDRVYVPTGDGNILTGIWKGFKDLYELGWCDSLPKLVACQSTKSDAISKGYASNGVVKPVKASTIADSISVDYPRDGVAAVKALYDTKGYAVTITDEEILEGIEELGKKTGIFVEPAAAAAWAGWKKDSHRRTGNETHVVILTGNGLKDIKSAMIAASVKPVKVLSDFKKFKP